MGTVEVATTWNWYCQPRPRLTALVPSIVIIIQNTRRDGTENVIWAGFGPVDNTEKKKIGDDYEQLLRAVFSCFHGQKKV